VADRAQEAARRLTDRLAGRVGRPLIYTRGGVAHAVVGWPGRDDVAAAMPGQPGAGRVETNDRDYLIPAAQLAAHGLGDPLRGDTVTETIGGEAATFEVLAAKGGLAWRWADTRRTRYRVHCKPVG